MRSCWRSASCYDAFGLNQASLDWSVTTVPMMISAGGRMSLLLISAASVPSVAVSTR